MCIREFDSLGSGYRAVNGIDWMMMMGRLRV